VWGSNGEYIVNADAASKYRSLLDIMNNGGNVGNDNHFANGGIIGSNYPAANSNHSQNNHFDFRGANFGGTSPEAVADQIDYLMKNHYGPQIVKTSAQTSVVSVKKLQQRQVMNKAS
jgi:hypothetical protein